MSDKHDIVPVADTVPTRALMHPLVERMLTTNPTPEALEKILTLQREWERGEASKNRDVPARKRPEERWLIAFTPKLTVIVESRSSSSGARRAGSGKKKR